MNSSLGILMDTKEVGKVILETLKNDTSFLYDCIFIYICLSFLKKDLIFLEVHSNIMILYSKAVHDSKKESDKFRIFNHPFMLCGLS